MAEYKINVRDEFAWQPQVIDKDIVDSAGAVAAKGNRYLINGTGAGDWSGEDYNIAQYNGSTWDFIDAVEGMTVWVEDENLLYTYDGSNWEVTGGENKLDYVITRTGGLVTSFTRNGITFTITRGTNNAITSITDGNYLWTYTRDGNNKVTAKTVTVV